MRLDRCPEVGDSSQSRLWGRRSRQQPQARSARSLHGSYSGSMPGVVIEETICILATRSGEIG